LVFSASPVDTQQEGYSAPLSGQPFIAPKSISGLTLSADLFRESSSQPCVVVNTLQGVGIL
ncbi:MAG: hypothetical protein RMJ19_04535, partial [Gemmatales bacterium]|nr:hypothetical protein [Gemmatales bacterium]MDW8174916.1 hypothetical protein [Gemmatales bacterium]